MDKRIVKFINEHHVLTLATAVDNKPYCANCFYVYMEDENMFVLTSDANTKHVADVMQNNYVGGSVVLETNVVGKIQGIQFNGIMYLPKDDLAKKANKAYMKKYPFAKLMNTRLWVVELSFVKMTHNLLGFGKKLIWENKL